MMFFFSFFFSGGQTPPHLGVRKEKEVRNMGENPYNANVFVYRVTSLTRPRIHLFLGKQDVEETISIGLSFKMFGQTFEARESSTPMRYTETGSKMINENVGVKHNVLTPEGAKKRRSHGIYVEKGENHDNNHD